MDFPRPLRSCILCRQRKIKCDRQQPCANCDRVESQCVYPAGPGRAPKRPRKAVEARLLAQLSKLETVVKRMEGQATQSASASPSGALEDNPETGQHFGRLVIDDMQSCYVSSAPWTRLGDEIEELRDLLHEPASDDDEQGEMLEGCGANASIMGFRALAHSLQLFHPPVPHAVALFETFKTNVSPLVHVFHMPTLDRLFWDAIAAMDSLDKNVEALLFAVYYSAVISLDSEQCVTLLGITRASALETYRFAVEQAMARADLLNTQNLILLQAAVLFLTALRNEDDSRTVWSLSALVYHIAQAMGLHRDGEAFGLRPLETELRRRLWWHICLLDNRSTEYHGCEPIVHESIFDTKIPLNINDADLTPEMTHSPGERDEATEMTFCLMRCHAMRAVWKTGYLAPGRKTFPASEERPVVTDREAVLEDLQTRLQNHCLKYCDPAAPFLRLCSTVARLMMLRMRTAVLSPLCQKDQRVRDRLFTDSIEVLQLSTFLLTGGDVQKWAWHSKTHIQWHAVAFVLAELCSRPPSLECDRAWECVNGVYDRWSSMITEKKGTLWRPIRRLMARARYVREMQKTALQSRGRSNKWRVAGGTTPATTGDVEVNTQYPSTIELQPDLDWENIQFPPSEDSAPGLTESMDPGTQMWLASTTGGLDATALDIFGLLYQTPEQAGYLPDQNILPSPVQSRDSPSSNLS
ncbi:hypothetical protein BDW59DRAFT_181534 [Aspergillus cavernicola]|uniref:Zn(2)-C6 fungal-type domain-containing protein n=1 Tax=Aspergillus cavernicola TaxID=176166 RepID=A0ABR4HXQ9_9EURO